MTALAEPDKTKLGILAGGGLLPARIAERCEATGRPFFIIAFKGHTDPSLVENRPHLWARLGGAAAVIERLHGERVEQICFIGPVRRPSLTELAPDARAAAFFAKVGLKALGDNSLLSAIADALVDEGFGLVGAKTLLADMLLKPGAAGKIQPDEQAIADIKLGQQITEGVGRLDIGQSAIIQQGLVIAVEAIEGTDAMIKRSANLLRLGPKGVLVKTVKPNQDRRLDLPTIGLTTMQAAASIGLAGVAAGAESTLVADIEAATQFCDSNGLFLYGFDVADAS